MSVKLISPQQDIVVVIAIRDPLYHVHEIYTPVPNYFIRTKGNSTFFAKWLYNQWCRL